MPQIRKMCDLRLRRLICSLFDETIDKEYYLKAIAPRLGKAETTQCQSLADRLFGTNLQEFI